MPKYNIEEIPEEEHDLWDAFVDKTPQGTIFDKVIWQQTVASAMSAKFRIFGCYKGKELLTGCATYSGKKREISGPPLTPYHGILIIPRETREVHKNELYVLEITKSFADFFSANFNRVTLVHHPSLVDVRSFLWNRWIVNPRYTYVLPLTDSEMMWDRLSYSTKKKIKKTDKNQIRIFQGEDVGKFYNLYELTFRKQNKKTPISKKAFLQIFDFLCKKGCSRIYFAEDTSGQLLSARIEVVDRDTVFDLVAGADPAYLNTNATPLLLWHIIQDLSPQYSKLDFVGADVPSIAAFKSNFGGKLIQHFSTKKINSFFPYILYHLMKKYRKHYIVG